MLIGLAVAFAQGLPAVPQPHSSSLDWGRPITIRSFSGLPAGSFSRHIPQGTSGMKVGFSARTSPGFRMVLAAAGIEIQAYSRVERAMAIDYLNRLAKRGTLAFTLPAGTVEFRPKVAWRGAHLFVGPRALAVQKKLWTRVLLPLGFNKVVLQCQQTEWKSLPNLKGGISMKRDELAKLCDWYRSVGVEVIPLVESFGHITWMTRGGKNLDLVINPDIPFTLDPREPRVALVMNKLWDEVIAVTKAKTIHYGLDEIDFRGMPKNAALVTKLWTMQVPMLAEIAARHGVKSMVWGDQLLARDEGAPPTGAPSIADAKIRRSCLPRGTIVCDWHYQNFVQPGLFEQSIRTLQREGFMVAGSSWRRPLNVQGMAKAAIATGAGNLVTTWAGHELNESVIKSELRQFSSFTLAAAVQWGDTSPKFDPDRLFLDLYGEP